MRGRDGRRIDDAWSDGARAYLGVTTAGFPNLFMLYGPNTNNGSILAMIESQVDYALRQIERIADEDLAWLDVRPEPMERYNDEIQRAIAGVEGLAGRLHRLLPHAERPHRDAVAALDDRVPRAHAEARRRTPTR